MSVRVLVAAVLLGPLVLPAQARTELWGYVDGHGVAHFASHAVDSRYRLVLGDRPERLPVPGKTDAAERLLTWMEIAPEVKALQPLLREAALAHGLDSELLHDGTGPTIGLCAFGAGFTFGAAVMRRG